MFSSLVALVVWYAVVDDDVENEDEDEDGDEGIIGG